MKTSSFLVFACLFFFGCDDKEPEDSPLSTPSNEFVSREEAKDSSQLEREISELLLTPIPNIPAVGFQETSLLQEGSVLDVFGGNRNFLQTYLGGDTCTAMVEDIFFQKFMGQHAFVKFNRQEQSPFKNYSLSISLYYLDSKRGYDRSSLSLWRRIPTSEDKTRNDPHNLSPDYETVIVEENIGFRIKP